MTVRPLTGADATTLAPALARLPLMQRYGRDAGALGRDLHEALARGEGLLVAEDGQGPGGVAWFLPHGTFALGAYLRLIAVVPGRERRGVGAELLAAFERSTAAQARHAFLLVSDFNLDAQRFYARHGYQRVGLLPGLVLPDVDEALFWKRLR
ncbi:MAG: GNAT family N-acetyltransferase [Candidatus Binatia bacterium]